MWKHYLQDFIWRPSECEHGYGVWRTGAQLESGVRFPMLPQQTVMRRSLRRHDLRSSFWWSSLSCTDASSPLSLPLFYRTCTFGRWSSEGQQIATLIWIRKIKRSVPPNLNKIAPEHKSFRLQDVFRQVCESHNIPMFQHISTRCLRFVRLIGRHSLYRRR